MFKVTRCRTPAWSELKMFCWHGYTMNAQDTAYFSVATLVQEMFIGVSKHKIY